MGIAVHGEPAEVEEFRYDGPRAADRGRGGVRDQWGSRAAGMESVVEGDPVTLFGAIA